MSIGPPVLLEVTRQPWLIDTPVDGRPDWEVPVCVGDPALGLHVTLAEVMDGADAGSFTSALDDNARGVIAAHHGFQPPRLPGFPWKGAGGLSVACLHRTLGDGTSVAILLAAGEFQPGRYVAHLEGIWRLP